MTMIQADITSSPELILASSSPYRREILAKLGLPFQAISPDIDESPLENETPEALVSRLALEKAQAIAGNHHNALIIGSDQVAVLDNNIITKPHEHQKAIQQLRQASGREVTFLTSLCLYNSQTHKHQLTVSPYSVSFLSLNDEQIEHYLQKEKPYNCAGSFKSEGLGITLFSSMSGDDPNSLIGLPLITLTKMLRNEGIEPLFAGPLS
ncbi:MAG: Maf family protein [Cellvibrionaceae bacterium]